MSGPPTNTEPVAQTPRAASALPAVLEEEVYTARSFSVHLRLTARGVKSRLGSSSHTKGVRGQQAQAWPLSALPSEWLQRLETTAREHGFRTVHDLLIANGLVRWKPKLPWAEIQTRFRADATVWRDALAGIMPRWVAGESRAELLAAGAANYQRITGRAVKPSRVEYVANRTEQRDAGRKEFAGPALYLDDAAFHVHIAPPTSRNWFEQFQPLNELRPAKPENPTDDDRAEIFQESFVLLETLQRQHPDQRHQIARALADFLIEHFPPLSKSAGSLLTKFRTDMAPWAAAGRAFEYWENARRTKSGYFRRPDFRDDLHEIRKLAWKLDGNEAGARRILEDQGTLSAEFIAYYPLNQRTNKSALPKSVRQTITPLVEAALPLRSGPKAHRDQGPYIARDWSKVRPGDRFVFDDVKFNHPFKYLLPDGRWDVTCGECLCAADALTDYPLSFLLMARTGYNGLDIRRLCSRVHDQHGLPHVDYHFERGTWESRFVVGEKAGWESVHWRDFERGLKDPRIGIGITHARIHRSKTIEGWFHHLQDRMRCIPGFVGFNERVDKVEHMQKLIARARRQDAEALARFPTQERLRDLIVEIMDEYAHTPSNGDRIPGRTPAEEWNKSLLTTPLRKLGDNVRHILDTHTKIARLDPRRGIVIRIPGRKGPVCYVNKHTGALIARGERQVRVCIDLEHPERLTVSDMKGTLRFAVRGQMADAMNASREDLAALAMMRRDHQAPPRALFGEIKSEVHSIITRDEDHDEATKEDGRFHREAMAAFKSEQSAQAREISELNRRAAKLGRRIDANLADPKVRASLDMELEALELERGEPLTHPGQ